MPQSVWWMRMISSVPSRFCEIASERISSSVTTPPALRITWASPSLEAERAGRVEAGVHAGDDGDLLGGRERQVALVEARDVGLVVLEQLVGL